MRIRKSARSTGSAAHGRDVLLGECASLSGGHCDYAAECESEECDFSTHSCVAKERKESMLEIIIVIDSLGSLNDTEKQEEAKIAALEIVDAFGNDTAFLILWTDSESSCKGKNYNLFKSTQPDQFALTNDKNYLKWKVTSEANVEKINSVAHGLDLAYAYMGEREIWAYQYMYDYINRRNEYYYYQNNYYTYGESYDHYRLQYYYLMRYETENINWAMTKIKKAYGRYVIIFTDGAGMCDDITFCDAARGMRWFASPFTNFTGIPSDERSLVVPTYTIGYMVGGESKKQFECITNITGDKYYEAPTNESLNQILADVINDIKKDYEQNRPRVNLAFAERISERELRGECTVSSECAGKSVCIESKCVPSVLHIAFVPVNWRSGSKEFEREVEKQADFFAYSLPSLKNCSELIKITKLNKSCEFEVNSEGRRTDLERIEQCAVDHSGGENEANQLEAKFDYVVGIGEDGIFEGNMIGYSMHKGTVFLSRGYEVVTAHEIGHEFGLKDEYCDCDPWGGRNAYPNYLSKEFGCDPDGDCCWGDTPASVNMPNAGRSCSLSYSNCSRCCEGNMNEKGGRSIMSWANAEGPRYHDKLSLDYLEKERALRCPQ
ncbi:MAG: hypothetical protein ABIH99_04045 [Candidatus Micrarchaeota archaeon]